MIPSKTIRGKPGGGVVWPASGTSEIDDLGDPFGHRTFSLHSSTVDFHRGVDIYDEVAGAIAKTPIHGNVIRAQYSHFPFDDAEQADQFTESDAGSKATFEVQPASSRLQIVGKNDGTVTMPSGLARYRNVQKWSMYDTLGATDDWMMDLNLAAAISTTGRLVMGVYDEDNDEYAILAYDGSTFTVYGKDAGGAMSVDATTDAVAGRTWLRIKYTDSTGQIKWQYSTDNSGTESGGWTDLATEGTITWTRQGNGFTPFIGWDPAAAGDDDTVNVEFWGWWDAQGIGRFGNWVEIAREDDKVVMMHFRHLLVEVGDVLYPGQGVGKTGQTGFDVFSGRIQTVHCHVEHIPNQNFIYANDDPINPLAVDFLPRPNFDIDIDVVRDTAMDPYTGTDDCHRLTITVQRGSYSNFQINRFVGQGNLATRTLNWNTRSGLDPADHDANNYNGVYFRPIDFSPASSEYRFELYFSKAVIGDIWQDGFVFDTEGNQLWQG